MNTCPLTLSLEVSQNAFPVHEAGWLQLVAVRHGALRLQVDDQNVVLPSGTLFATPGEARLSSWAEGSQWTSLRFKPSLLHDELGDLPWAPEALREAAAMDYWLIQPLVEAPFVQLALAPPRFEALVRSLLDAQAILESKTSPFWRCFARGHVFDLLQGLRRAWEFHDAEPGTIANPWVAELLLYLHAQLAQAPRLEPTARHFGLNRSAFSQRVRAETGQSFHEVLSELRLRKAEWLVRQTQLPIARIAEQVGLHDQTHFTRLFKATFSVSPLRYRQTPRR